MKGLVDGFVIVEGEYLEVVLEVFDVKVEVCLVGGGEYLLFFWKCSCVFLVYLVLGVMCLCLCDGNVG